MIIFISGMHGVGKTLLVNSVNADLPMVKYVNVDIVDPTLDPYSAQIERMERMALVKDYGFTLVDRSPGDFFVYIEYLYKAKLVDKNDYKILKSMATDLLERYKFNSKTLLVGDDYDVIINRIKKRSREIYNEDDDEYNRLVYKLFYDGNKYMTYEEAFNYLSNYLNTKAFK